MVKRIFAGFFIAAAALIFSGYSPANADTVDDFIAQVHQDGIESSEGNSDLIAAGRHVCQEMTQGESGSQIAKELFRNSHLMDLGTAQAFVLDANLYLCPGVTA